MLSSSSVHLCQRDSYFSSCHNGWIRSAHYHEVRFNLHLLLEDAASSTAAMVVSIVSVSLVLLSCVTFVVESLPALREHDHPEYKHVWFEVDGSFAVVFSLEFLLRLWCTNETYCLFLKDPLNIVDIFAVSPFWVQLALKDLVNLQFLRALRLFRVFRIFKLAHSSVHLRIMVLAITQSTDTLVLLMVFLAIAVFVFASAIWYVERGEWDQSLQCFVRVGDDACSPFESIPGSFYWAVTTMTTVGYGDQYPITSLGRIITGCAMVAGIMVIAMPVSVIGSEFQATYVSEFAASRLSKLQRHLDELPLERKTPETIKIERVLTELVEVQETLKKLLPEVRAISRVSGTLAVPVDHLDPKDAAKIRKFLARKGCRVTQVCDVTEKNVSDKVATLSSVVQTVGESIIEGLASEEAAEDEWYTS